MIGLIRQYFRSSRRRAEMICEARKLLAVLDLSIGADAPCWLIVEFLMANALEAMKDLKAELDRALMHREMDLRIKHGPRPQPREARLN